MQILFSFLLLLCTSLSTNAQTESGIDIIFSIIDRGPTNPLPTIPHAPIVFPQATLDGHTLYITRSVGAELLEVRQNDVVVYQTLITTDNPTIILPESITGDCEIILYCPVFTFVAFINL